MILQHMTVSGVVDKDGVKSYTTPQPALLEIETKKERKDSKGNTVIDVITEYKPNPKVLDESGFEKGKHAEIVKRVMMSDGKIETISTDAKKELKKGEEVFQTLQDARFSQTAKRLDVLESNLEKILSILTAKETDLKTKTENENENQSV